LLLQYGRVVDAKSILEKRLRVLEKVVADKSSPSRTFDLSASLPNFLLCFHIHGEPQMMKKLIDIMGLTFDSAEEYLVDLLKDHSGFGACFSSWRFARGCCGSRVRALINAMR
jgi:hypothetical protein